MGFLHVTIMYNLHTQQLFASRTWQWPLRKMMTKEHLENEKCGPQASYPAGGRWRRQQRTSWTSGCAPLGVTRHNWTATVRPCGAVHQLSLTTHQLLLLFIQLCLYWKSWAVTDRPRLICWTVSEWLSLWAEESTPSNSFISRSGLTTVMVRSGAGLCSLRMSPPYPAVRHANIHEISVKISCIAGPKKRVSAQRSANGQWGYTSQR